VQPPGRVIPHKGLQAAKPVRGKGEAAKGKKGSSDGKLKNASEPRGGEGTITAGRDGKFCLIEQKRTGESPKRTKINRHPEKVKQLAAAVTIEGVSDDTWCQGKIERS